MHGGWNSSIYIIHSHPSGPLPGLHPRFLPRLLKVADLFPPLLFCYFSLSVLEIIIGDTPCCQPGKSGGEPRSKSFSDDRVYTRPARLLMPLSLLCSLSVDWVSRSSALHGTTYLPHPPLRTPCILPGTPLKSLQKGTKSHLKAWTFIFLTFGNALHRADGLAAGVSICHSGSGRPMCAFFC